MITVELARSLGAAGVLWEPAPGDRFTIDQPNVVGEVFWISHLTIDVHTFKGQPLLGFNGTTEWALDSVTLDTALWLPREDQLRELLGDRFAGLQRADGQWTVDVDTSEGRSQFCDPDPECAYARALLSIA
ncbi:hypothetical protein [Pedococcus sp. 5OH_020]|uniref:hypothetical protein n=1 Tax=Pedococcus sp. 5OH_020 TaxID=2989814 RepID=UPI0022E9CC0F|nr:hypothetical protein [Pedococcus sp. 5OH_020]